MATPKTTPRTLSYYYGNTPLDWTPAYGGRTTVAAPGRSFATSISQNIGNLGALYGMAGNINEWQQAQTGLQMESALPGFGAAQRQSMANIGSWQRGEVAPDVISQLIQGGAERGISTGQGVFSPNANAAYLRALGITSMDLQKQGEEALTGAVARTPRASLMSLAPWLVTGEQEQEAQQAANVFASMPNPAQAAAAAEAAALRGMRAGQGGGTGTTSNAWVPGQLSDMQRWVLRR